MEFSDLLAWGIGAIAMYAIIVLIVTIAVFVFVFRTFRSIQRDHEDMRAGMRRRRRR